MSHPSGVRMKGPLVVHQDGLWADLRARGYAWFSAKNLLSVARHLSLWLESQGLSPSDLTGPRIEEYLRDRRASGYICWRSLRGLRPILRYLRSVGAVPAEVEEERGSSPRSGLLQTYQTYLLEERGITSAATVDSYLRVVRTFLTAIDFVDLTDLPGLSPAKVSGFLREEVRLCSVGSAKIKVTALRSFLRYLHLRGHCLDLLGAVPAVAGCRDGGLPKGLSPEEVRQLLETCGEGTAVGRRDRAILLLLSRLGLRAIEVAGIELEDVAWTRGELRVRGKGRHGVLPLPEDVGQALEDYLRQGRPDSASRRLFLTARAPHRELTSGTVGAVVRSACRGAGLPPCGSHRLRHTVGTQMLRKGASLAEVAHVLGHQSLLTTAIYAKVDRRALRELARHWLGGES